jgi:hypothetical protein
VIKRESEKGFGHCIATMVATQPKRLPEVIESESEDGLSRRITTVAAKGLQSHSCWYRLECVDLQE